MATPADLAFLATMLQSPGDRRACVTLLAGPRAAARTPLAEFQSVKVQRSVSHGPRRIYRVYGSGGVEAPAEVALEALSNLSLIPAWDLLFKGARYLEWSREEAGGGAVEVGRIHLVYGLPGVSRLIHDRDFVLRALRVFFPSGVCMLCCRSVEAGDGDPPPGRNMVRGHMWSSGYVVVPEDGASSTVNISLQVDPKGWIPTRVVNMSLEAIPLNIARLRGALARLSPDFAARLSSLNRLQARNAKPAAHPAAPADDVSPIADGTARGGGGGGGSAAGSASGSEAGGSWEECEEEEEEAAAVARDAPKRARLAA